MGKGLFHILPKVNFENYAKFQVSSVEWSKSDVSEHVAFLHVMAKVVKKKEELENRAPLIRSRFGQTFENTVKIQNFGLFCS